MNKRLTALLGAAAALAGCHPVTEKPGPPGGAAYVAPPPEARRNPEPSPDLHRWLAASDSVRGQLRELRDELASLQQLHVTNHFDHFLSLDPAHLDPAQLCYLEHFLARGYFRIEREVLLKLLENHRSRSPSSPTPDAANGPQTLAGRLQAGLQRDETLVIDMEAAIHRYRAANDDPIPLPVLLTEAQLADLRTKVTTLLQAERQLLAELDQKIHTLRRP